VNASALETWGDEFEEAGIKKAPSRLVRPPRVADSPVSFECRVHSIVRVANESHGNDMAGPHLVGNSDIVIGRVVGIHIKGEYITGDGVSQTSAYTIDVLMGLSSLTCSRRPQLPVTDIVSTLTSTKSGTWTFR
jgi:flavin reductase (DIM6/NTAB) family NADH-FMN oxidoreductase RutF